ncbi:protein RGF1 INDUCIBLE TRANSCRIPTION FACTOR 1-like isoform X2 [Juglans microcarpa x Juglans regia]|uniref:protein RGF1 INDUCIBLE TRANSCRIPTION FACTOR 1-like isoform X2 n=1 Tax=Juglans microcarpa x Juglans regia TaxID=2249226 RepID=UPI001B7F6906|nr:protein RGF1 INDUCIBLE TRANSCRIPTION FACTOR 1-like isoform X2 [Juglans microcarpa x Juglans regia]
MKESIRIKRLHASRNELISYVGVPPWLIIMNKTIFFSSCIMHPNAKKNDLDYFCIDCRRSLCSNCLPTHMRHKYVKTYHTNKAKVVFLKQRPHQHNQQQQQNNAREYRCIICERNLQDNSLYCSIACKVLAIYDCQTSQKDEDHRLDSVTIGDKKKHALSLTKRRKLRRKGARPSRAPMF